jgi:chemotaxis protein CheX
MNQQVCFESLLLESAREVFETTAFLEIQQCEDMSLEIAGDSILSTITFKGAMQGCLGVRCSIDCAKSIALAMLGMDPSESLGEAEVSDSLGEICNMVLGGFKARVRDTIGNLEVSIPSVIKGLNLIGTLGENSTRTVTMVMTVDGNIIEVWLLHKMQ